MKLVSVVIRPDHSRVHPIHRALIEADGIPRADVLMWDAGRRTPATLARYDAGRERVTAMLDDVDIVDSYVLSGEGPETYAFVWQTEFRFDPRLADSLTRPALLVVPPVGFESDGTIGLDLVGTRAALAELADAVGHAVDYSITGVREYDGPESSGGLTDRQREAVEVAVELGYYDVPRTGSITDVADRLGCAESTASELVRKAQAAIVRDFTG